MSHPYKNQPQHAFWQKSVNAYSWGELNFMPTVKFELTPELKIVTAGSCFAQHIAKRLDIFGLQHWIAENAPSGLPIERQQKLQYGVFSARYANIYTVRQLRQLIEYAFGLREEEESPILSEKDRFFDGLRPRIQPDGYSSITDLRLDRSWHLKCVKRIFSEADVFIFTLGLTEAWIEKETGVVFPVCPGTAAGDFDADLHHFVNFEYDEILDDMDWVYHFVSKINPKMQWIITVSPVPLVATGTDLPVIVASNYSKSVLRAVAGKFAQNYKNVEYFPSYEIISSAQSFGQYLEGNLRDVSPRGVNHVMRVFANSFIKNKEPHQNINTSPQSSLEDEIKTATALECEELMNNFTG